MELDKHKGRLKIVEVTPNPCWSFRIAGERAKGPLQARSLEVHRFDANVLRSGLQQDQRLEHYFNIITIGQCRLGCRIRAMPNIALYR